MAPNKNSSRHLFIIRDKGTEKAKCEKVKNRLKEPMNKYYLSKIIKFNGH